MEVPRFLLRKKYLLESVLFVALFSFVFMALYQPFSTETVWFGFVPWSRFVWMLSFYVVAIATLLVSKYLLYRVFAVRTPTMPIYVAWLGAEFAALTLLYILFSQSFDSIPMDALWFVRVFGCVAMILIIPYTIIGLYAAYRVKKEELNLIRLGMTVQDLPAENELLHLCDNNGIERMTIDAQAIYYVESQDNYVRIYYELEGRLVSYMLRCKTQRIEEMLAGTALMRCHRSYIVNLQKIKCYKRFSDHATIYLSHASAKAIPVSKSYFKAVTERVTAQGLDS